MGASCKSIVNNMLDVKSMQAKVAEAVSLAEGNRIDILVNSAGVYNPSLNDFLELTEEGYDSTMNINLKGVYFMCQAAAKYMIENGIRGHILNISSQAELEPAFSPYRLSKWGVRAITSGLAKVLLPHGIIVNAIAPGPCATDMQNWQEGESIYSWDNPAKRLVMPEEVAEYALLMASDMGNMVVGSTLYISGGRGVIEVR